MNALVLGATGHLGNALTRELLARGWEVTATSRREGVARNLVGLRVRLLVGDSARPGQLDEWIPGHELVVDAAAPYHLRLGPGVQGAGAVRSAVSRMEMVVASVARHDACLAYVSSFTTLARSRSLLDAAQSRVLRQLHPYFEMKSAMERRVRAAVRNGLRAVIVNPTICFGPWDLKPPAFCLIPLALQGRLPATTSHAVNVIDVRDVAAATVTAVIHERFGAPIELSGHNTTVDGLVAAVCRLGGARAPRLRAPAHLSALVSYGNEVLSARGLSPVDYPALGMLALLEQRWLAPGRMQRDLGGRLRPLSRTLVESIDWYRAIGYLDDPHTKSAEAATFATPPGAVARRPGGSPESPRPTPY